MHCERGCWTRRIPNRSSGLDWIVDIRSKCFRHLLECSSASIDWIYPVAVTHNSVYVWPANCYGRRNETRKMIMNNSNDNDRHHRWRCVGRRTLLFNTMRSAYCLCVRFMFEQRTFTPYTIHTRKCARSSNMLPYLVGTCCASYKNTNQNEGTKYAITTRSREKVQKTWIWWLKVCTKHTHIQRLNEH